MPTLGKVMLMSYNLLWVLVKLVIKSAILSTLAKDLIYKVRK